MVNNKYIKEALNFQELTEEEKQRRGILARLWGPCASIVDSTRNGRLYSDELQEKVFNENEIVKEMFENGGCPMALDHPQDREDTCSEKIAAMLPEPPKRDKDGHLICYVDLIDTPCGKIAYQLAKYGFKLGISSRGTGDLVTDANGNESVDPDTYDFTTFDLVLLPAVKDARLNMCESYDTNMVKFKRALTEAYNDSSIEDRRIMDDTLKDLNIALAEPTEVEVEEAELEPIIQDVPLLADEAPDLLAEDMDTDDSETELELKADEETEQEFNTVQDLIDFLGEFNPEANLNFGNTLIGENEYQVIDFAADDNDGDEEVTITLGYSPIKENNIDSQEDIPEETNDEAEEATDELADDEDGIEAEKVDDIEFEGVMESLKAAIRQKDLLEKELKSLKSNKTVNNVEVEKLQEDLERYKMAFARTSEIATNAKKFESEVKSLTEQLKQKNSKIQQLESIQTNTIQLTESRDANLAKVKALTEQLHEAKDNLADVEQQLTAQTASFKKQLSERTKLAKEYKAKFENVLNKYVASKASMLGVKPSEITNKLDENYSIEDVDRVYNRLLTEGVAVSRVPGISSNARVKINEAKQATSFSVDGGYEIDDDLLILAGLK